MRFLNWWNLRILLSIIIVFLSLSFAFSPPQVLAETIFLDEFNGTGELSSYNNAYRKLLNFNDGSFTLFANHVRATGYDPAYVYTGILGNNVCASVDFNWGGVARWTGIMLRSVPGSPGSGWQDMFSITQRDMNRWTLYVNAQEAATGPVVIDLYQTHTLKACINGTTITGYIDGILLGTGEDNANSGGYVGFSSQIGTNYLDNFRIEDNSVTLGVPELKQTDSLWTNTIYDSAQGWFSQDPTIGRWGCALTSAAMVFKYHGLDKLPDGTTDLRPDTLNTWLLTQPDGYVGNGLVNWLALTRLSKLASPFNSQFDHDALEFSRINGENKAQLTQDLQNGIPDILEVPGHFVVAKGEAGATFKINDPFYSHTDLTSYLNSFSSLSRFIPSNTDLSYIMAVVNSDVDIILKNSSNQIVGESFIQNPISLDGVNKSGSPVKILYFKKPQGGDYLFTLTGNTSNNYFIKTFLYDENGNVKVSTDNGIVGPNDTDQYSINFNKVNSENSSSVHNVTFDSFIQDINSLFNAKKINFPTYMSVSSQAKVAKNLSGNLLTRQGVIQILKSIDKELLKKLDKGVSENAYSILHSDIQTLLASL